MKKKGKGRGKRTYLTSVVEKPAKNINPIMASKVVVQKTAQLWKNCASSGCAFSNSLSGPEVTPPLVSVGGRIKCELLKPVICFLFFFTYDAQQIQLVPHPHSWALLVYYRDDYLLV